MREERRYGEDEIGEIFAVAARESDAARPAVVERERDGLTLAELQEIGRDVGLSPESVAAAASALDVRGEVVPRSFFLGTPVGVGRVVELPRGATDREWEVLVTEIRETFAARGRVASHGGLREWTNGNLHVFLEPTVDGHRLRMGTHKRESLAVSAIGGTGFVIGVLLLLTAGLDAATFGATLAMLIPLVMAVIGGGVALGNRNALSRWADERERQMEHIGGRALELLSSPIATES